MQTNTRWRETLSICADIIQVTTFFGLSVAAVISIGVAMIGFFSELSPIWNAIIAVSIGLASLLVFNICARRSHVDPLGPGVAVDEAELNAAGTPQLAYLTANQVVHYLAGESDWGAQKAAEITPEGLRKNALLEAPIEFKNKAEEGRVRVYGANSITGIHELIPKTFWMSCGLDYKTVFDPDETSRTAPATLEAGYASVRSGIPKYSDLKIEAADVYATWPLSTDRQHAQFDAAFAVAALSKDSARKELWRLRKEGVAIRNEPIASNDGFQLWKQKYETWRKNVLEVAEKYDENLRERLEVLDRPRQPPNLPVINQEHALYIKVASEMLLRIEENLP